MKLASDLQVGDLALLTPILGSKELRIGEVMRVSGPYLMIQIHGHKDRLRVAKVSGKGTLHGVSYVARGATELEISDLQRLGACEALAQVVFLAQDRVRLLGPLRAFESASGDELQELAKTLRRALEAALRVV